MPVDRSTLPPLPGKPDWYLENAPAAIDQRSEERSEDAPRAFLSVARPAAPGMSEAAPVFGDVTVFETAHLDAPEFPTAQLRSWPDSSDDRRRGRKLGKVKTLAGRFKH